MGGWRELPVQPGVTLVHMCGLCLLNDDPADVQEDPEVYLLSILSQLLQTQYTMQYYSFLSSSLR